MTKLIVSFRNFSNASKDASVAGYKIVRNQEISGRHNWNPPKLKTDVLFGQGYRTVIGAYGTVVKWWLSGKPD